MRDRAYHCCVPSPMWVRAVSLSPYGLLAVERMIVPKSTTEQGYNIRSDFAFLCQPHDEVFTMARFAHANDISLHLEGHLALGAAVLRQAVSDARRVDAIGEEARGFLGSADC